MHSQKHRHLVVVIQRHLCNAHIQIYHNLFWMCANGRALATRTAVHVWLCLSSICAWDTRPCTISLPQSARFLCYYSPIRCVCVCAALLTQNFNSIVKLLLFSPSSSSSHFVEKRNDLEENQRQHHCCYFLFVYNSKLEQKRKHQQQCQPIEKEKYWSIILFYLVFFSAFVCLFPFGIH